jgi:surface protein
MSGIKQTILQSNTSLTLSLFFSTFVYNIVITLLVVMMIWNNTAPLLVPHFRSQRDMFNRASSFNQDLSDWNTSKVTKFVSVGAMRFCCLLVSFASSCL